MEDTQTIVNITIKCNQNCVFCSGTERAADSEEGIIRQIKAEKNSICIEGGEPTIVKDLVRYVKLAKEQQIRDIILVTNGVMLSYKKYCEKLLDAGVTLFSISFPHPEEIKDDAITRVKGNYQKRIKGIKNLIELGAGKKVRFTFVVNKTNYTAIPEFVKFVKDTFPEIFYIEINYIKKLGYVKKATQLIPRLPDVKPYFTKAMEVAKELNVKTFVDGFPLCYMKGYEDNNIDTLFLKKSKNNPFINEKYKPEKCNECEKTDICSGMRLDYYELFGDSEIYPIKKEN